MPRRHILAAAFNLISYIIMASADNDEVARLLMSGALYSGREISIKARVKNARGDT